MIGSQSRPGSGRHQVPEPWRSIRNATEPLVVASLASHGSVVALAAFAATPPLLTAFVATIVFAGISLVYGRAGAVVWPSQGRLRANALPDAVILAIVGTGGWLLGQVLGTGAAFYCEPLVPWRIEIALFGSFGLAYFTFMARQRRRAWVVYPLALLALLGIAPFYGFFSAPLFLGVSLTTLCPGRPIVTVVLVALGMRLGEQVGLVAAGWLSGTLPPRGEA